jgi:hypothetical protein
MKTRRSLTRVPVKKGPSSVGYGLDAVAILAAIALVAFPFPSDIIEEYYANGLFSDLNRALVPIADSVPVSIGDVGVIVMIAIFVISWIATLSSAPRFERRQTVGKLLLHSLGWLGAGVIVFELLWGLNYRRDTVVQRIVFEQSRITDDAVAAFSERIVDTLNNDVAAAHRERHVNRVALAAAFEPVVNRLGDDWNVELTTPKFTILQPYYEAAGVGGQYSPFSFETLLNSSFLSYELPAALAHEWAHVGGFTDEGDANYIAVVACLRSDDPLIRYSGAFWTYGQLPAAQRKRLRLDPRVSADFAASRARFYRHFVPLISDLQWSTYDGYLRTNGVRGGVTSYGFFLRLLVGTQLDHAGLPLVKRMLNPI